MASIRKIARVLQSGRTIAKGVSPRRVSVSPIPLLYLHNRYVEHNKQTDGYGVSKLWGHACLTGLLGFGLMDVAYAYNIEDAADDTPASSTESSSDSAATMPHTESLQTSTLSNFEETKEENGIIAIVKGNKIRLIPPPFSRSQCHVEIEFIEDVDFTPEKVDALVTTFQIAFDPTRTDLEKTARREKLRLEAVLRSKGERDGSYPPYTVGVKGEKLAIKFKCARSFLPFDPVAYRLITTIVKFMKCYKPEDYGENSVRFQIISRTVELTMHPPPTTQNGNFVNDGELSVLVFIPIYFGNTEVEITKKGSFTTADLDVVEMALKIAGEGVFELLCKLLSIEVKVNR